MDSSALIFVALAVAWAVYLIPKALEHHEESVRSRTIERFSHTMRVLARREPVNRRRARLVPTAALDPTARKAAAPEPLTADQVRQRRTAAAKAARRRLRVVSLILLATAVVAVLAWQQVFDWVWAAIPVGVLVVWLVACRLMVRREIAQLPGARIPTITDDDKPDAGRPADSTEDISAVDARVEDARDPDSWDPVPVTLPTYVAKAAAPRSVRTIDLDSTGVWTSGRSEADSALVREAGETRAANGKDGRERAVGS